MTPATPLLVALAAVLLVLAASVAAAQVAVSRLTRVTVEQVARRSPVAAQRLTKLALEPRRHGAALLLVRTFAELGAAACVTVALVRAYGSGLATLASSTALLTVTGFLVLGAARALAARQGAGLARWVAAPVAAAATLLGPLARVLPAGGGDDPAATEAELRDLVDRAEQSGVVDRRERDLIRSVFELGDTIVREVMVPRPDVVFIERTKTVRQALSLALRSGFSRIPVVGADEDDVVGIAYLKDLTRRQLDGRGEEPVAEVLRPASYVPDSKPVDELLRQMQSARTHLAVVVDEYGGTAGLVTIEDILEELVGEIADEYDREAPTVAELGEGCWRVTARLAVEDLAELTGVPVEGLRADEVETVGGLLASALGRVPIPGASASVAGLRLEAESTTGRRHRVGSVVVSIEAS